jgi:hypothetical protein
VAVANQQLRRQRQQQHQQVERREQRELGGRPELAVDREVQSVEHEALHRRDRQDGYRPRRVGRARRVGVELHGGVPVAAASSSRILARRRSPARPF